MTLVILLSILNLLSASVCCGCFLRVRMDYDYLISEKKRQVDLIERYMKDVVTHDDIRKYMDKIDEDLHSINEMKGEISKEKWKQYHTAFGGKEGVNVK